MRVLITGVTGFAGSHLAEYVLANAPEAAVYGTYRWRSRLDNLEAVAASRRLDLIEADRAYQVLSDLRSPARAGRLTLLQCDLTDAVAVERLVTTVRPDRIFHLAAQSLVQSSFYEPAATLRTNILAQLYVLEAARKLEGDVRIHVAGSSEEYGLVHPDEVPMKETNPLRPLSPYAVSKVAQDKLAWQYHRSYGMHVVVTRAFNHTGPRRGPHFVTSTVARQIAEIEHGLREPVLYVGDVTSKRDWHDIRDTVRAYWVTLERGRPGEAYNVGSGRAWSIKEMLEIQLGHTSQRIEVREDPARLRPSDVPILLADVSKFRDQTGWRAEIPFETTLRDLLDYWRARTAPGRVATATGM